MRAVGTLGFSFNSLHEVAAFVGALAPAPAIEVEQPPAAELPASEADDWEHAAANSKGSFDTAIDALRDRLERSKVQIGPDITIYNEDCLFVLPTLKNLAACVCDPPYELGFMGRAWDKAGVSFDKATWKAVSDALLPGAHLAAYTGTRTYHRIACAIEDAGFECRDMLGWVYGSGFPKSMDVSKAIDKAAGAERDKVRVDASEVRNPKATGGGIDGTVGATRPWIEKALEVGYHEKDSDVPVSAAAAAWQGFGTALKPAFEPACFARKPLSEKTIAANVLKHGTGALNIDACRVATDDNNRSRPPRAENVIYGGGAGTNQTASENNDLGRWPANLCHDGSEEVLELFPRQAGAAAPVLGTEASDASQGRVTGKRERVAGAFHGDSGSAARFFYCAKVSPKERGDSKHPTMKPIALMEWLCKLVTPPGGTILDPFMGSGSTGLAAIRNGFKFIGIEKDPESFETARKRLESEYAKQKQAS